MDEQAQLDLLIRQSKNKEELVASTVRLPATLHAQVEELAEDLGVSRQVMLTILVGVGAKEARKKGDKPNETHGRFHLLNTNRRNRFEDEEWMLENQYAAAFYSPWKETIDNIKKGDVVFLYSSGVGIVAYGTATGMRQIGDYVNHEGELDKGERYFQKLNAFRKLKTPMKAEVIRKIAGNVPFLLTRSTLQEGAKLLEKLEKSN